MGDETYGVRRFNFQTTFVVSVMSPFAPAKRIASIAWKSLNYLVEKGLQVFSGQVLSVDEKSQIQALDRTQPGLPMKPGRAGTMTHDYKRHGTTTLFAALNILDGTVIGRNMQRHRHQEFIRDRKSTRLNSSHRT